jgi:hypothetical protein
MSLVESVFSKTRQNVSEGEAMWKRSIIVSWLPLGVILLSLTSNSTAQMRESPYAVMAPLDQYLIPDEKAEIALARSAAPASVSSEAEVMVLGQHGYTIAVKGSNDFLCIVERSWANTTDNAEFWNPKMRAPHCLNSAAASAVMPFYLMKTKLVLAGNSRAQIAAAIKSTLKKNEVQPPLHGTIVYMMSKQQYLNDQGMSWHPHVMFYASGDAEKSQGANQSGSPVMAAYDPEERVTTFFVLVPEWSDGTPGPTSAH